MRALYFNPFFDEHKCSYRFSYCLCEMMKQNGVVLDRIDYKGMGDSEELFSDVTLDTIRNDMDVAIPMNIDVLIGLRFGASMICDYLKRNKSFDCKVILIEPIFNGDEYVEYLLRKQRLKDHLSKLPIDYFPEKEYLNIEGYRTSHLFIEQIRSFTLPIFQHSSKMNFLFTRARLSNSENAILSELKKVTNTEILHLKFPDIWERIPIIDYHQLIKTITEWCNES